MCYIDRSLALPKDSYARSPTVSSSGRRGRTVLIVDDDTSVLALLGETITSLGHKVIVAQDGPDAVRCLLKHRSIDCLFSDVVMPNGMTGLQLMAAARAVRPGLPAVLASAYPREQVCAMGRIPDDVQFIAKPYLLTDLYPLLDGETQPRRTASPGNNARYDRGKPV